MKKRVLTAGSKVNKGRTRTQSKETTTPPSLISDETIVKKKGNNWTLPKPIANTLKVNELLGLPQDATSEERQEIYKQWF